MDTKSESILLLHGNGHIVRHVWNQWILNNNDKTREMRRENLWGII